ncbi:hypothetical protein VIGAN_01336700 [Vigna angularis var. angularis]|uniref:Homeobox-leucine zipper protein n=2 Tax=Phaseolus angularis TaxID=3914 RepID=A0A0S3R4S2_PHAAN|nr:homeobox-leucine zipper protein ATHB-40 [Vigna angularis]BAT75495.1 hypothetical protein VIGAN_01336700 [Vigna angularis var. angularis]
MNNRLESQMMLFSHQYPGAFTEVTPPQQGKEAKPRRKRNKNGAAATPKKRKLTAEQVSLLEKNFCSEQKLESERKDQLAFELGMDPRQVAVWFQNRRFRWKTKKLEEEYSNLKNVHETTMLQKCHLETRVLKLEEQLLEAKKEIQQLQERDERAASKDLLEAVNPPFPEEFRVEEYDYGDVFYIPETHYINGMEWINLYM